ncbi:hypothetical protein [Streptomyces boncukensis]|uniref:Uncharacterized protein n=1 Tax=Streptomyces boncukensis TaxID=2711219 RepID=A0A6G4X0H3_9ACTN|nr:hypothetical protein [Streptomyces boncukensis]NGO70244.1 hypothetical protein [Streptomyces boncukensis]
MSEPTQKQPPERLVTARDGMVWTLRATRRDGEGLYAPEDVKDCPRWVMARGSELVAEHGARPVEVA